MHLGPIQADRPEFQHACLLCEQEDLHKELLEFWQEGAPKCGEYNGRGKLDRAIR
jgi:hypothetical protein